jgi:hypothetical protein
METVTHPNCPACKQGIGEMHKAHEKDKPSKPGEPQIIPAIEVSMSVNINPLKPPIIGGRLPAIRSYKDVCEECGCIWSFMTERGHVTFTGDQRQPFRDFT